jgi:methionyl-tRNA formyltransferase
MRILLFAPTATSLYSRATAQLIQGETGLELDAIVVRRMWDWKRLRAELRRDGPRLIKKIREKFILGAEACPKEDSESMGAFVQRIGLPPGTLRSDARRWGIPCLVVPDHNHPGVTALLRSRMPQLTVFTGGGLIRQQVLDLAGAGVLNCHSGLLPAYRGMDVVEWPVLVEPGAAPQIGLTTHWMDRGVDTGPILLRHQETLREGDTFETIRRRLEPRMPVLMLETLRGLRDDTLRPQPQTAEAGRQYFVMHPRFHAAAERKLARVTGGA